MTNDNMKKWLSALDHISTTPVNKRMLTEEVDDVLKDMHSKAAARPSPTTTPGAVIKKIAGGLRGYDETQVQSAFDTLSKKNGFANFADELKSAAGAHGEEMRVSESVVDEEDMEEGNEFSDKLTKAKKQHKKSFKVGGKTYPVKESEEVCSVCEAMPCECEGSKEDMIAEEWSVIYDSAYAKNVPVQVRLKSGMDESAVREWFSKAFQPLNIHEVFKRDKADPKLKPNAIVDPPRPRPRPGSAAIVDPPRPRPKSGLTIEENEISDDELDEALGTAFGGLATTPKSTTTSTSTSAAAGAKNAGTIIDPKASTITTQDGKTVKLPPGTIKTKGGNTVQVLTSEERHKREDDSADYDKMLDDVHTRLEGNYDLDAQHIAIQAVADLHKVSYEKLLVHWFEDPKGLKLEKSADDELASEQPPLEMPVEQPPAELPPAAQPAASTAPPPPPAPVQESRNKKKKLKEGHQLTLEVRDDHEVRMAQASLYQIAKHATALHSMLDGVNELEGWVQSKITLASDYIERVRDYMEYELVRGSEDGLSHHTTHDELDTEEIFEDRVVKKKKK